jgi:hypothetical protein
VIPPRYTFETFAEDEDLNEWTDLSGRFHTLTCKFCPARGQTQEEVNHVSPCPAGRES